MSAGHVECSVLVPVLDEERDIAEAVAAMQAQTLRDVEFIFADGGSRDRTREILAELAVDDPRIRLCDNPRRTVTSGLNVALSHARGRYVARFDAHSTFPPDYLRCGIARLSRGDTRWVSGPQLAVGRTGVSRAVAVAVGDALGRAGSSKWSADDAEWELDTGVFCGVWERETLLSLGGWDERWRVNEDSELASRMLTRGERLIGLAAMAAQYRPRDTLRGLGRQYRTYGIFRVRTAVRHPASLRAQHLAAPALVLVAATAAFAPSRRPRRLARALLLAYAGTLGRAGLRAGRDDGPPGDAALVPVVLATMHAAFGLGYWEGVLRFGPPWRALARVAGARRFTAVAEEAVHAPSLRPTSPPS